VRLCKDQEHGLIKQRALAARCLMQIERTGAPEHVRVTCAALGPCGALSRPEMERRSARYFRDVLAIFGKRGSPSLRQDESVPFMLAWKSGFGDPTFPGSFPVIAIFPSYRGRKIPGCEARDEPAKSIYQLDLTRYF